MPRQRLELPVRRESPDADPATLDVSRVVGGILVVGGIFASAMARVEGLGRTQRRLAVGATGACGMFGVVGVAAPRVFLRALRRTPAPTLPAAGLIALALTRPVRSPMFFPAVLLSACGGGPIGPRNGRIVGVGTSMGYLVLVAADARRRTGVTSELWWNAGVAPTFATAAHVGGVLGDLAMTLRTLEFARARDLQVLDDLGSSKDQLGRLAAEASAVAAELDQALLDAARFDLGSEQEADQLEAAIAKTRARTHHLTVAPLLIAAAQGERVTLRSAVETTLAAYSAEALSGGRLTTDITLANELAIDARSTTVLLQVLKRALDNAVEHAAEPAGVAVRVQVYETTSTVAVHVEDDGEGSAAPEAQGQGLSEAEDACEALGGVFRAGAGLHGVRVVATVPKVPVEAPSAPTVTMTGHVEDAASVIEQSLRWTNAFTALATFASARSPRAGALAAAAFTGLAAAEARQGPCGTSAPAAAAVRTALFAGLWPRGAKPPSGWLGANLFFGALRAPHDAPLMTGAAVAGALAAIARGGNARQVVIEHLTFPAICGLAGVAANASVSHLERVENEIVALHDRAELVERAAQPLRHYHDIVKGLRTSDAWKQGLMESDAGQRINHLGHRLSLLNTAIEHHFVPRDPVGHLQHRLAVRLAPTPVTVDGHLPEIDVIQLEKTVLRRARQSLALERVGEQLADVLLASFGPDILGRARLERVHLHFNAADRNRVALRVRPIPSRPGRARPDRRATLVKGLAAMEGRLVSGFDDGGLTLDLPATALAHR